MRFHAVHVAPPPNTMPHLVVVLTTDSLRIEGLDVESAAQLVARLR